MRAPESPLALAARPLVVALLAAAVLAAPASATAPYLDQANNCIVNNGFRQQWVLPTGTAWHDLATTVMTARATSDAIVSGLVGMGEGNTPGTEVEYRLVAGGSVIGRVTKVVPPHFPHTEMISALGEALDNAPNSGVTIKLQAKNNGTAPVYFFNATIQNVFVADVTGNSDQVSAGNKPIFKSWTNIADIAEVTIPADDDPTDNDPDPWLVVLGARVTLGVGQAADEVDFKFYDRTNLADVYTFDAVVPPVLPDGYTLLRFYDPPGVGQRDLELRVQGRRGSTTSTTRASQVDFFVQVMRKYHLYSADGINLSLTKDGVDNVLLQSSSVPVIGAGESDATFNFAIASYTPDAWAAAATEGEARWRVKFYKNLNPHAQTDGGLAWGHFNPDPHLSSLMAAGCGSCGRTGNNWDVRLQAQAMCGSPGGTVQLPIESASVQVHWFPSEHWFTVNGQCTPETSFPDHQTVDWAGTYKRCCVDDPDCHYDCDGPVGLATVSNSPKGTCF